MKNLIKWLCIIGVLVIISGCDNIQKCFPTLDIKDIGAGFKCTGEF